jgi:subtilisin family serine protease
MFGCLLLGFGATSAEAAGQRYWIRMERAASNSEAVSFPAAPPPNERALERRALRGDPARIAVLDRLPDSRAIEELRNRGIQIRYVSRWLSAASCELDEEQLEQLRAELGRSAVRPVRSFRRDVNPLVGELGEARASKGVAPSALDYGPSRFQSELIQADQLHALGLSGAGVRALVMDTGFFTDLAAFEHLDIFAEHDFVFDDDETANEFPDSTSQQRHGTGVLGLFAGFDPGDIIGPGYAAEVVLAKTEYVSSETRVEEDNFVAALEWGEALGVDLVTASLGYCCFDDSTAYADEDYDGDTAPTSVAMDAAAAFGVLPLVAVGNRGSRPGIMMTPADADSVVSVGSVDADSTVSDFSSRGPTFDGRFKPEVAALGRAAVWTRVDGDYGARSGTSAATPQVAGIAAMLIEAHPQWNAMQYREALLRSASQSDQPDNNLGHGIVRGRDALFILGDPEYPMPFELLTPGDGDTLRSDPPPFFAWRRPTDYQSPSSLRYALEFSETPDFDFVFDFREGIADSSTHVSWLPPGEIHWRVRAVDGDGNARISLVRKLQIEPPPAGELSRVGWARAGPAHPNPATEELSVQLRLLQPATGNCEIYDLRGRRILSLLSDRRLGAGLHFLRWDGRDARSRSVASGSYLLRLELEAVDGAQLQFRRRFILSR